MFVKYILLSFKKIKYKAQFLLANQMNFVPGVFFVPKKC